MNFRRDESVMKKQAWTIITPIETKAFAWLDSVAEPLQKGVEAVFGAGALGKKAKSWLNGTPIRHRIHPAFIIIPLGAWTTAELFDALEITSDDPVRREGYAMAADAAVAFGILGVLPTAATGLADWVDTYGNERRVGTAHALLNTTALGLYIASWALRRSGQRGWGQALALAGYSIGGLAASIGGEMVYGLGLNVNYQFFSRPPDKFVDVLAIDDLPADKPVVVEAGDVPVLLMRQGEEIFAVENWCTHAGGPLSEGTFEGCNVICPWHGSRFCLRDGVPLDGPAVTPLRTFEVREQNGRIAVRPSD
jgi:nitrite reductase/ring-hydroxylating ferredoxin subunit